MASEYKVIKISCRRKNGDTASYVIQNGDIYDQIKVLQKEISYERGDIVDTKYIDFIKKDKLYKDYQKINCREKRVYASNLIEISNFIRQSYKDPTFLEEKLLWKKIQKDEQNPDHSKCAGKISDDTKEKTICRCMYHYNSTNTDKSACKSCSLKPKWHNVSNDVDILEYEFPTTKKYENVGGMDLIFEYKRQIYACEIKPENSTETLARMFAEILTYTLDTKRLEQESFMKKRKPKPAIGFFENSKQHKEFDKYKTELKEDMDIICEKISVFIIKTTKNKNGIIDFKIEPYN